jgi:hypothetical protein
MGKPALVDGDAGDAEPVYQLRAQLRSDLITVAAQCDFLVLEIVVGVA